MKNLYGLIYMNDQGDCLYSIVLAEGRLEVEKIAYEDAESREGFSVYSLHCLDRQKLEAGEVIFVGG